MKLNNTLYWHDAGGCHWCGRNTDSMTEGHDGMCPIPLLVLFEAEVERLTSMTYCAFCGEEFDLSADDATDAVEAHIHDCEKHPLFAITEYMRMKEPAKEMLKKLTRDKRKLEVEVEKLRGFWTELCEHMFECWEFDGGNFQDMGEKFGLLVMEIYDPEGKHKDMNVMDVEPGDECWFNVYAIEAGGE